MVRVPIAGVSYFEEHLGGIVSEETEWNVWLGNTQVG